MVLQGMANLLQEKRGDDYLVNFFMLEFCTPCMEAVRKFNNFDAYDLKTFAATLESMGFEAFLMGPRYLPLTHGSWDDAFLHWTKNPQNQCGPQYTKFRQMWPEAFPGGECLEKRVLFTGDIFALRSSHPKAASIKVALGACEESQDFHTGDPRYDWERSLQEA